MSKNPEYEKPIPDQVNTIELKFKFELGQLVAAKPFYNQGRLVIPPHMERYTVEARFYTEGIRPGTKMIDCAIAYHVKIVSFQAKAQIATIKESDLKAWAPPTQETDEDKAAKSGIVL